MPTQKSKDYNRKEKYISKNKTRKMTRKRINNGRLN